MDSCNQTWLSYKWKRHEYHDSSEKVVNEINRLSEREENDDLEGENHVLDLIKGLKKAILPTKGG